MYSQYKLEPGYFFPILADNLFCGLTVKSLAFLAKIKKTKRIREGGKLFSAGEMPCAVYLLREGQAHLFVNDSRNTQSARPIELNEILGSTEVIANLPYGMTAETITSCLCECIRREDFIRFLYDEPDVCFRLLQTLSLNLQKSYQLVISSIN